MRRGASGFSLVEVAIALGIVAFGLVAVLGLLPVGLNLAKDSSDEVIAVNIMAAISADLKSAEPSEVQSRRYQIPLDHANDGSAFFNLEGKWLGNTGTPVDAAFVARWKVRSRTASTPPVAHVVVAWPAKAATGTGSIEALLPLAQDVK